MRNNVVAKCRVFSQTRDNKIGILPLGNPHLTEAVVEHANGFNLTRIGAFHGVEVDVNTKVANFKMPVTGRVSQLKLDAMKGIGAAHNYYNAAVVAFFVIGLDIGISATAISSTVEKLKAPPHRMQIGAKGHTQKHYSLNRMEAYQSLLTIMSIAVTLSPKPE